MRDDDQRLEQQRHGPHAEQRLEHDEQHERRGQTLRLRRIVAMPEGEDRDRDDHEHETAGDEAMEHLPERLVLDDRAIRKRRVGLRRIGGGLAGGQVAITARPVRAAETGVIQAHPRAEHDDAERDQRAQQTQLPETAGREQRWSRVHGVE